MTTGEQNGKVNPQEKKMNTHTTRILYFEQDQLARMAPSVLQLECSCNVGGASEDMNR